MDIGSLIKTIVEKIDNVKTALQVGVIVIPLLLLTATQVLEMSEGRTIAILCLSLVPFAFVFALMGDLNEHYRFLIYLLFIGWSFFVGAKFLDHLPSSPPKIACSEIYRHYADKWREKYEEKQSKMNTELIAPLMAPLRNKNSDDEFEAVKTEIIQYFDKNPSKAADLRSMVSFLDSSLADANASKCNDKELREFLDNTIFSVFGNYGPYIKYAQRREWTSSIGKATEARFAEIFAAKAY